LQNHLTKVSQRSASQRQGFALVVTLALMILITVIAVGLLSLSSVALRTSSQNQARQMAQANARMALMLAIGQLQVSAGPDQRVSATADIAGGTAGNAVADMAAPANDKSLDDTSKGLSAVQAGTRYWTGIWKNRDDPTTIYSKTPAPQLLQWLVSGNEEVANAVTPASTTYGLKADGTVKDATQTVILAGAKSAGNLTNNPDYYVSAPLVPIKGLGSAPTTTTGRYAWWVGDEGVKAKINLVAPYKVNDLATAQNSSTQRSGWEVVAGYNNYPLPGTAASSSLNGVVSLPQTWLLASPPATTALAFHSATTDSCGVLADTLQGGLRLDLSAYLAKPLPTTAPASFPNALVAGRNIIPATVATANDAANLKGPKWDRLKEFGGLTSNNLDAGSLKMKPATTDSDYAIAPLIVELRLLLGARFVTVAADTYNIHACAKIAVTLANPYSYPMKWSGLDLEIKNGMVDYSATSNVSATAIFCSNYDTASDKYIYNPNTPAFVPNKTTTPAVFNNAIFHIPAATLAAGASIAYTVASPVVRPAGSYGFVTVPLAVAPGTGLDDFRNAVILENNAPCEVAGANSVFLDVRESANTSQVNVELRPTNKTTILRKLERLELNDSESYGPMRGFGSALPGNPHPTAYPPAGNYVNPFPLQLYIFQMSQPGVDYGNTFLPTPADMGLRNSTLRTYADFNLQATRFRKPITSYNPPPYVMRIANSPSGFPVLSDVTGITGATFTRDLWIAPLRWGRSLAGSETTVLFNPPPAGEPIMSLAQFQHADLTADDRYASVGHQPGNAFGNSYASPFVTRQSTQQTRNDYEITGFWTAPSVQGKYYDISYLLNAALWDTYFCSTIPATGTTAPLNPKLVKLDPADESSELRDGAMASARLLVNGAFNVNSTSKDAWKAFLAGSRHLRHPADTGPSPDALFSRSLGQKSPAATPPTGTDADSFAGFRRLSDAQLDALADEITKQVRLRGPFVSLSHFVNRSLVALTTNKDLGRSGALQSALDLSGANISPDGSKSVFTGVVVKDDRLNLQADSSGRPKSDQDNGFGVNPTFFPDPEGIWSARSSDCNPGSAASILADKPMLTDAAYRQEQGLRSTGIPGWLTQADVLQVIGPSLAARSDTFKIRAYGEALDPTGKVTARAWCEAVVQRVPAYLDPANPATARDATLSAVNQKFGRKFNLVSFRWLSPDEI
jgi:Tfp pilus assembly protein PilX